MAGQGRGRGRAGRDRRRRPHLAGPGAAGPVPRQIDPEHLGQRPDVGVLPEASDEVAARPGQPSRVGRGRVNSRSGSQTATNVVCLCRLNNLGHTTEAPPISAVCSTPPSVRANPRAVAGPGPAGRRRVWFPGRGRCRRTGGVSGRSRRRSWRSAGGIILPCCGGGGLAGAPGCGCGRRVIVCLPGQRHCVYRHTEAGSYPYG